MYNRDLFSIVALSGVVMVGCVGEAEGPSADALVERGDRYAQVLVTEPKVPEDVKLGKARETAFGEEGNISGSGRGSVGTRGFGLGAGGVGEKGLSVGSIGNIHGLGRGSGSGGGGRRALTPRKPSSESYQSHGVNGFIDPSKDRFSTFAVDVDTASYTIARRKLSQKKLPPAASVRVEEFINFFDYDYKTPKGRTPFDVDFEAAVSPFEPEKVLLRVGLQGRVLDEGQRKPAHLVFLVDTSGSMNSPDKLGLAQRSLQILVNQLRDGDTVALCTYAGRVTEVLQPTGMEERARIYQAIEGLRSGGSTAMADGLETAYKLAYKTLKPGHINRVIVLSDGDANIGASSHDEILRRIGHYTKEGVTLSTVGFGMGNYKDTNMEQLANKGNGNYYYIDNERQARRVFKDRLNSTLQVIAKDVKIQVEFDPRAVEAYRLVGYENRDIADRDFRNDAVDAGEIGAGHAVTALYELRLARGAMGRTATVRIRHKKPQGARASESSYYFDTKDIKGRFEETSLSLRLATTAMALAEKLRGSDHAKKWEWSRIKGLVGKGEVLEKDENELLGLVDISAQLSEKM